MAKTDEDAFIKASKIFENMYKDSKVKKYLSCIELTNIDGYTVTVSKEK